MFKIKTKQKKKKTLTTANTNVYQIIYVSNKADLRNIRFA